MDELIWRSASSLAKAIRDKEVSSEEVIHGHLRRIEGVNPKLNAVVQVVADSALSEAREADASLARGNIKGPLHGVPMTIKDSLDTVGVITTGGTKGRACYVPKQDATAVARMRAAGAILLGKTNTPELTLAPETNNLIYGRTNNPYDLSRTPGGSSGGAGAIVAAGGSPVDLGSDTGGSIRWPSHCCGIAGIKPTSGRVPRTGHIVPFGLGALDSLTQIGPMARFVEDLVLTLPVISGVDWQDPAMVPMPLDDPEDVDLKSLRVAVYTDDGVTAPTPETAASVKASAEALADTGADVEENRPEALEWIAELNVAKADGGEWVRRLLQRFGTTEVHPWSRERWFEGAKPLPTPEYTALLEEADRCRSSMLSFMKHYHVILCPVGPYPAPPHDAWRNTDKFPGKGSHGGPSSLSYTRPYNLTGWPTAVVRAGTSPEGLPLGVQVVARPWREDVALAVAQCIEAALGGWQRPPI